MLTSSALPRTETGCRGLPGAPGLPCRLQVDHPDQTSLHSEIRAHGCEAVWPIFAGLTVSEDNQYACRGLVQRVCAFTSAGGIIEAAH